MFHVEHFYKKSEESSFNYKYFKTHHHATERQA